MKIDVIVSGIESGGGITTFVVQLCKILGQVHSLRLIVTHIKTDKEQVRCLLPFLRRGVADISDSYRLWRYVRLVGIWINDMPEYIINNYNAVGQYVLPILRRRPKNIHVVHGITYDFKRVALINKKHTSHWVAPSMKTVELLTGSKISIDRRSITLIPHGVGVVAPSERNDRSKRNNIVNLIYVGVLEKHKGADVLAEVVKELERRRVAYRFDIIGNGSLREKLIENLMHEITEGNVVFHGHMKHEEVLERFRNSDILVYPTRMDSFGLVIAEAMMAGCVPIAGKIKGVTDQIIDNARNGFVVAVEAIDIVEKICKLVYDNRLLAEMSEKAILKAKTHYSLSIMSEAYNQLLRRLL